jgi:uncharacterized protein (TIGR00661 family)
MKILYAIQGTGNGHITRALDIVPVLQQKGEVDLLVSGIQSDIELPFPVKYTFKGLSFIFGKKGGIDFFSTYRKSNLKNLYKEIQLLPVENYDMVISDFEPVSAWACKMKSKLCIGLSHQAAVIHKKSPKPKRTDPIGLSVLKYYAPTDKSYGYHFESFDSNIFTPVIREQIRNASPKKAGHYTVYLPAYGEDRIKKVLGAIKDINWQVFCKHTQKEHVVKNIKFIPIDNTRFVRSMINSNGVLCGAGFETPAEAMFLGKKLMVIPMKSQFEQHCNASALNKIGVPVLKSLKPKHIDKIADWIHKGTAVKLNYKNQTTDIINKIFDDYKKIQPAASGVLGKRVNSFKKLKSNTRDIIISNLSKTNDD